MTAASLTVFITYYALVTFAISLFEFIQRKVPSVLPSVVVALASLVVAAILGTSLNLNTGYIEYLVGGIREQSPRYVLAACLGIAAAIPLGVRLLSSSKEYSSSNDLLLPPKPTRLRWVEQVILAASITGVVGATGLVVWDSIFDVKTKSFTKSFEKEFVIDEVAEFPHLPLRVAVDSSNNIFVNYYWVESNATYGGGIVKIIHDPTNDSFAQETVASSSLLYRAFGLAVKDGNLYVSRSGHHAAVFAGKINYKNLGAVTQLEDIDKDGYFEYYHDILTDLPGSRGPDMLHQNNGIAFGVDGSLFITSAANANRDLDEHPWGGTVLRLDADFQDVSVVAHGFRNPFGITVTPGGQVFLTDNDVEENPGDEINHIIQGEHYGHPFVLADQSDEDVSGFRSPIFIGGPQSNYVGVAYTESQYLPEKFRHSLYVADLSRSQIVRVKIERTDNTFKVVEKELFASIPTPLDIAIDDRGTMYVVSRYHKKLFRIRMKESS